MTIITAVATRQGTEINNADSAAVFAAVTGRVGAALVDIAGHDHRAPFTSRLMAETAARIAPQRGPLAALCTAGLLVADPGADEEPEPNGVAVAANIRPGGETRIAWVGDSHAYAWDGATLTRLTTPHTWAQQAQELYGLDIPAASDILTTSLATATPATVITVETRAPLVLLASDGLDALTSAEIADLIERYGDVPQALATALVNAPRENEIGYRDDTTVVVITNRP